jgi:excisionase family DNA binding protein
MTSTASGAPWTEDRVRSLGLHTDVATAASILGIGRSTAYDLIRRGEFPVPVVRLGHRLRIPVEPLRALLSGEHR